MKVYTASGNQVNWPPSGYTVNLNETRPRSSFHLKARELIQRLYPLHIIMEEVPIPGEKLYCDFVIPTLNLVVEVHGQQHYEFNSFYYRSKWEWAIAKQNDKRKQEWLQNNNIRYCELPYDESEEQWEKRLQTL